MIFRHAHDFQATAVEHSPAGPSQDTSTVILWRCECADVFSERIEGVWTLPQVRGETADAPKLGGNLAAVDQHDQTIKASAVRVRNLNREFLGRMKT